MHILLDHAAARAPEEVGPLHILGQVEVGLKVLGELAPHKRERGIIIIEPHL
jgi:hypothetical protein